MLVAREGGYKAGPDSSWDKMFREEESLVRSIAARCCYDPNDGDEKAVPGKPSFGVPYEHRREGNPFSLSRATEKKNTRKWRKKKKSISSVA